MTKFTAPDAAKPETDPAVIEGLRRLSGGFGGFSLQDSLARRASQLAGTPAEGSPEGVEIRSMINEGADWDSLINEPGSRQRLWIVLRIIATRLDGTD